jgi:hypothetical protein
MTLWRKDSKQRDSEWVSMDYFSDVTGETWIRSFPWMQLNSSSPTHWRTRVKWRIPRERSRPIDG